MGYDFTRHRVDDLGTVWINGEKFKGIGYQGLLTVNTKTYVSEPTRANDGSMPNISDHETFVVPRCKLNFKYMSLDDYQRLCNAILPNEFPVTYYDKQMGQMVTHYMYAEPEEMTKIYNVGTNVIGVLDFEVSFIGTLNSLPSMTVRFDKGNDNAKVKNLATVNNGVYYNIVTYVKGDRVIYNDEYYEAIYEVDSFTGVSPTGSDVSAYWVAVSAPTQWQATSAYALGILVYNTVTSSGSTKIYYYECVKANDSASLSDTEYWKAVAINEYGEKTTYVNGDYACITGESSTTYYKAIYYVDSFSAVAPTNNAYWKKLNIGQPQVVSWGQSIQMPSPTDWFEIDDGENLQSGDKWQVWAINADGTYSETSTYYSTNQTISVLRSMLLKAVWVKNGN